MWWNERQSKGDRPPRGETPSSASRRGTSQRPLPKVDEQTARSLRQRLSKLNLSDAQILANRLLLECSGDRESENSRLSQDIQSLEAKLREAVKRRTSVETLLEQLRAETAAGKQQLRETQRQLKTLQAENQKLRDTLTEGRRRGEDLKTKFAFEVESGNRKVQRLQAVLRTVNEELREHRQRDTSSEPRRDAA